MPAQTEEVDEKGCKSDGISQVDGGQRFENRMCHRIKYISPNVKCQHRRRKWTRKGVSRRVLVRWTVDSILRIECVIAIRILLLAKHTVNRLLYVRGCRMVLAKLDDICSLSLSKSDLLGGCG